MLRKLICCVLGLAGLLFVTENSFAQRNIDAQQLLQKIGEISPRSKEVLANQPELAARLAQLLNELPTSLNQNEVLKTIAELVARYGMWGDTDRIFRRLERELRTSRNRSFSNLTDILTRRMNNVLTTAQERKNIVAILEDFQVSENAGPSRAYQGNSALANNTKGGFVICWTDERSTQGDIYAQHYNSAGVVQGTNFKVNDDIG